MNILKIKVTVGNVFLFECSYIELNPYAPNSSRTFKFTGINLTKAESIIQNQSVSLYQQSLNIKVYFLNKTNRWDVISDFKIHLFDFEDSISESWIVSGLIYNDYNEEYKQGLIDVFEIWQNDRKVEWFECNRSNIKRDYFSACLLFSGISTNFFIRDYYQIDVSLIKEEKDFLYLASVEFFGDKGYFGHDIYSFKDCLLSVYKNVKDFKNIKVVFKNSDKIYEDSMFIFYGEIKSIFKNFGFILEEY